MHARSHGARRLLMMSALVVLGTVAAACGGGDDAADTTTTTATTPTTEAVATTTVAPTTTVAATTTTELPDPVYPLTGLPVDDPARAAGIALVVKIDNAPPARPQSGLGQADIVVEEIVNDSLTRFGMVFHQFDADPVGPIRSGRLQDIDLFSALNKPLFAWSGGNPTVTAAIRASDLRDIGPSQAGAAYYRESGRKAPHNLYSNTPRLRQEAPLDAAPPPQWFQYREGEGDQGTPSAGIASNLDAINVVWTWNAATALYEREMEGRPHEDRESGLITTDNVVVLVVEYTPGISGSPDAQTLGTGEVFVHTGGRVITGTWSRDDIRTPFDLRDADGEPILLAPGRTFIELPRPGNTLALPAA